MKDNCDLEVWGLLSFDLLSWVLGDIFPTHSKWIFLEKENGIGLYIIVCDLHEIYIICLEAI